MHTFITVVFNKVVREMSQVKWKMHIILSSTYQTLLNFMDIWRSS